MKYAWFAVALTFAATPRAVVSQTSTSLDAKVQAPEIGAPQRGSLIGQLASTVFGPADVSRGAFSLPSPFVMPEERGELGAMVFPAYSPDAGISEWGQGWQATLAITRTRVSGDIDYATDDLSGPWGRMIRGADGYWYPVGLSHLVRLEWTNDTMTAWLPDGTRYSFGGVARVATAWGTYAWQLVEVVSVIGRKTKLTWAANATGRPFLQQVSWGGVGDDLQYRADFVHEALPVPLRDYRSRQEMRLDQRVKVVVAYAKNASTGSFDERWRYTLTYQEEGLGPAFYLSQVTRVFRSGEQPPPVRYTYALAKDKLAAATMIVSPKVTQLLRDFGADVLQVNRSAPLDVDLDGQSDLERAYNFTLAMQTEAGFVAQPLPPAPPDTLAMCRPTPSSTNAPRTLVMLRSSEDLYRVVDLRTSSGATQTSLVVCNREGQLVARQSLSGNWALSSTVRLVDVDRDRQPDLVRVGRGFYQVLPNTSTAASYAFGTMKQATLQMSFTPDTAWLHDMNGDGIPDIVARYTSGLMVYYGTGNLAFDPVGQAFLIRGSTGTISDLASYYLSFADVSKDGLTDIILTRTTGNNAFLFINNGTTFVYTAVPGLAMVDSNTSKPAVGDFSGSGNTEVTYSRLGEGRSVALDEAATGLMVSADDGQGTALHFRYARSRPIARQRQRQAILAQLTVRSSGYEPVTYTYDYGTPRLHTVGKFFLGFDQVTRVDPLLTEAVTFLNEDRYSGVFLASTSHDATASDADAFVSKSYDEATFQGVAWKRLSQEVSGFHDAYGSTISTQSDYLGYSNDFCPQAIQKTTSQGVLTTTKGYVQLASFGRALSCLWTSALEAGTHDDPLLDFEHEVLLTRNAVGLVEKVESSSGPERWVLQTVAYRPSDWLVASTSSPGRGTSSFSYDAAALRLTKVIMPDGVTIEALARDPLHDGITTLRTGRGTLSYQQFFAFDGQERLASRWDDLGLSTALNPNVRHSYDFATDTQPASIYSSTLIDAQAGSAREEVDLLTAAGEAVVTATRIPQGWWFGPLALRDRSTGITRYSLRPSAPNMVDPLALEYGTLMTGANEIERETTSPLYRESIDARTTFHAGIERHVERSFSLSGGLLLQRAAENGTNATMTWRDATGQVLYADDEAGARYGYRRDALGRLREVSLPDGTRHRVVYDGHGRVSRVEREAVANVTYAFDPTTGLVTTKSFSSPSELEVRHVTYQHDAIGRVSRETHFDLATAASKVFVYYYDGATPASPGVKTALGLLTAVTGDGYAKYFEYRADGAPTRRRVVLDGWRTVETALAYLESGTLGSQTTNVYDVQGVLLSTSAQRYLYDDYGRLGAMTENGTILAMYTYGGNGELTKVQFANGDAVSLTYDPLTRRLTGTSQFTATYTASTTQKLGIRGLVDSETLAGGAASVRRTYGYSPQRFLTSSVDSQAIYGYGFDTFGLPTAITKDGVTTMITKSGSTLTAGSMTYMFDALGRTVRRGDLTLTYGPDGQIATATRGASTWTYKHDEAGQRLIKLAEGAFVAGYLDTSYLDASGLYERFRVAGRTVGLIKNGVFTSTATDVRGTVIAEANGTARFASPFGQRDVRPAVAAAIDYVEKGYDADLGLVRMGVRDYDPQINRWITPDPLFLEDPDAALGRPLELDLYSYAGNNPVNLVDPTGTEVDVSSIAESRLQELEKDLEKKTGFVLGTERPAFWKFWRAGQRLLTVNGVIDGKGSEEARTILLEAINSRKLVRVEAGVFVHRYPSRPVTFGSFDEQTNTITMNFFDFERLDGSDRLKESMSMGMVFMHEAIHAFFGLRDPTRSELNSAYEKGRYLTGAVVDKMNKVRQQLDLPERTSYETIPIDHGSCKYLFGDEYLILKRSW